MKPFLNPDEHVEFDKGAAGPYGFLAIVKRGTVLIYAEWDHMEQTVITIRRVPIPVGSAN